MKELQSIIEELKRAGRQNVTHALATIVKTSGSTYRRAGARMLVTADGRTVGSISGGCLERDVCERARAVVGQGEPIVVTYDSTADADIVWGLGLGCNGVVHILIEPLTYSREGQDEENNRQGVVNNHSDHICHISFLEECIDAREACVIATVFNVEGDTEARAGRRLMLRMKPSPSDIHDGGVVECDIKDTALAARLLDDARNALCRRRSEVKRYELAAGSAEVFLEVIEPPVLLVIFGAGHDAIPLAGFAKALAYHVTVVDSRPAYLTRFPETDAVVLCRPENVRQAVSINAETVAVVMTHNYLHDKEIVGALLGSAAKYIGVLGPRRRTERLLEELADEGVVPSGETLDRVYGPIGLDIGADAPEQIALSIVAEIEAVLANRAGESLRNRLEPIHNHPTESSVTADQASPKSEVRSQGKHDSDIGLRTYDFGLIVR